MSRNKNQSILTRALGSGHFPHQLSWLIDNPLRRLLITPSQLADRLPLDETSVILEIGPGSGYFSVELAGRVPNGRLELLDLQPEMLKKARSKFLKKGIKNVGYTAQDATGPLPYQDEMFDVVVLVAVLGEVSDIRSCLREIFRVVRPGGVVAVHEHLPDPDRIRFSDLQLMVEESGFDLLKRCGPLFNYTATFERPRAELGPSQPKNFISMR